MKVQAMLRITVHDKPQVLTLQLEGRLAGPWLRELEECWKSTLAQPRKSILCVKLRFRTRWSNLSTICIT